MRSMVRPVVTSVLGAVVSITPVVEQGDWASAADVSRGADRGTAHFRIERGSNILSAG